MPTEKEFKVNKYITLKLERGRTNIFVNDKRFRQCKFLKLEIPIEKMSTFDEIESIDQAAMRLDPSLERPPPKLDPETEFWGHCSNLQVWVENNYDTRLLHRDLAFPLLKKLTDCGDPLAKRIFKKEIAKRAKSNYPPVILYLLNNNYLNYLDFEQLKIIFFDLLTKIEHMPDEWNRICLFYDLLTKIKDIKLIENLSSPIEKIFSNLLTNIENMVKIDDIPFYIRLKHEYPIDRENMNKYYRFGTLIAAIKGTVLVRKKLVELLTTIEKKLRDYEKVYAFSELFDAIEGTNLMEKCYSRIETTFSNVLTVVENLSDSKKKVYLFSLLLTTIKGTDLTKNFSSKIERIFSNLLLVVENMPDNVKRDALNQLILAIKETDFLEKIFSDILKVIFKIDERYYKENSLTALISAIKGTDSVEEVKKIKNTLNILENFFKFFIIETFSNWIEEIKRENFLDENIAEILNVLENLQDISKFQAFSDLISPIKETKHMNILRAIKNLEKEFRIFESFDLITRIKGIELMNRHYSSIENKFTDFIHVIEKLKAEFYGNNFNGNRFEVLYLISSIKGTVIFKDNYNSIKKIFGILLQKDKDDPFYHDKNYLIEYSEALIQIMQDTKLIEFIPDLLKKIEDADELIVETRIMAFEDVLKLAKTNNLMGEYFSQFLQTVKVLLSHEYWWKDWEQTIDPYYEFVNALGIDLVKIHFTDLLILADDVPSGYNSENFYHAFFTLFCKIKKTKLMKGSLYGLLKDLHHKSAVFTALLDVLEEPELIKEKIMDVFSLFDEISSDEKYYTYAKLIDQFKAMQLINEYYNQLEERLFILLNKSKVYVFNFLKVLESIKETNLLDNNIDYLYKSIEKLRYTGTKDNDLKIYSKLIDIIKKTAPLYQRLSESFKKPNQVILTKNVYLTIIASAVRFANHKIPLEEWSIVKGVFAGINVENNLIITKAYPMMHQNINKSENLSDEDYDSLYLIDKEVYSRGDFIVGWWHSRPGFKEMSHIDHRNVKNFQLYNPLAIFLIFNPNRLIQQVEILSEEDEPVKQLTNDLGFKLFQLDYLKGSDSTYHTIDYKIVGYDDPDKISQLTVKFIIDIINFFPKEDIIIFYSKYIRDCILQLKSLLYNTEQNKNEICLFIEKTQVKIEELRSFMEYLEYKERKNTIPKVEKIINQWEKAKIITKY
ncbi:MAG: hypothetical protein ACFFCL_10300 [Promethearchaeota archaeon]